MFFLLENWTRIAYVNEDLPALSKEIRFMVNYFRTTVVMYFIQLFFQQIHVLTINLYIHRD